MGRAPDHIPEEQEKQYIKEIRKQGKMRLFVVAIDEYQRYRSEQDGITVKLYEAMSIEDLLKQLGCSDSLEELKLYNGDGQDLYIINELVIKKEGTIEDYSAKKLWEMLLKRECITLKPILESQ